ncbi:MbtH family protein [uncultured Bradyrhizobium sp.]|uniref:MbtH family protein n=1 Tax=uncultured Bradyrhizobium sp. TaxID=199684 RepID=UPI0035CA75F9
MDAFGTNDHWNYKVVRNHEEQYAIWPVHMADAPGWIDEGTRGTKDLCLGRIRDIWKDMRPLSLRQQMR